jgi:hypothetical protein
MKLSTTKWNYVLLLVTSVFIASYNMKWVFAQWHTRTPEDHLYDLIDLAYLSLINYLVLFVLVVLPSALLINVLQKTLDSPVIANHNSKLKYISSINIVVCAVLIVITVLFWINSVYLIYA